MKHIKAITDFGVMDVRTIGTKKEIAGELWIVANVPVKYMNSPDPLMIRKVLHYPTGASLPIKSMPHNAPAKDYLGEAEYFLKQFPTEATKKEVSKYETLNK
jgi:hypothetical protein